MNNSWKKAFQKAKETTSKAIEKSKDLIDINQYKSDIQHHERTLGHLIYEEYKKGRELSSGHEKVNTVLQDIDYCYRKIREIESSSS